MRNSPPPLVRLSVLSSRVLGRTVGALWSAHSGFWLAVLNDDAIQQSTNLFYGSNARFLDRSHNTSGLYPWEEAIVTSYCPTGGRVLVPAAGAGREVTALDAMGYSAVGYDPSPELISLGNALLAESNADATLALSHGDGLPADLVPPFDVVLFGWGGISHVRGTSRRIALFKGLLDATKPDGFLVVSFLDRPPRSRRFSLTYRVARLIKRLTRSGAVVEMGDTFDGSFDHYFTVEEIVRETSAAGFEEVERSSSPYSVLVCRKP